MSYVMTEDVAGEVSLAELVVDATGDVLLQPIHHDLKFDDGIGAAYAIHLLNGGTMTQKAFTHNFIGAIDGGAKHIPIHHRLHPDNQSE